MTDRDQRIGELSRRRHRDWFLRLSFIVVLLAVAWAWLSSRPLLGRLSAERRWMNFKNFLGDLAPSPVRKSGDWTEAFPWAWELIAEDGWIALLNTLGIATAAIIIAGAAVVPVLTLASRQLSRVDPFGLPPGRTSLPVRLFWNVIGFLTRLVFVFTRAIPEYLLAFLLLSLLGPQVWPLILALAIHNFGILGRLWGEVVENADTAAAVQGASSGSGRTSVFICRLFPEVFNRFLIYFFYRWETCVKDATVLGMLGLLTLGKLIALSKGFFWDRMFFYVLLGASVILVGDLFSTWVRTRLR